MEVKHGFNKSKIYHSICNTNQQFLIIDNAKEDEIKFENLIQELQRLYNRRHQIAGEKRPGASGGASINGIGFAGNFHHRF